MVTYTPADEQTRIRLATLHDLVTVSEDLLGESEHVAVLNGVPS